MVPLNAFKGESLSVHMSVCLSTNRPGLDTQGTDTKGPDLQVPPLYKIADVLQCLLGTPNGLTDRTGTEAGTGQAGRDKDRQARRWKDRDR